MQFKGEMSSKEAMNSDGSKRKGRAQKVGSRIMVNQLKTADEEKILRLRTSSSVSNAEIEVDKQSSSGKIKTVEISRHRSDLGLRIKRTRSAVTATSVRDETNLVKLRKLKSDSAKVAKSLDEKTMVADSDKDLENNQVNAITNNADHVEEEEKEMEVEVEKRSVGIKDIIITPQEQKPKKVVTGEKKKLLHSNDRSPPITPIVKKTAPAARIHPTPAKFNPSNDYFL